MKFTKEDFTFSRKEIINYDGETYTDYWFKTSEEADRVLKSQYFESGLEHIFEVVYCQTENCVGIKRQFRFNNNIIESDNEELKALLKEMVAEIKE